MTRALRVSIVSLLATSVMSGFVGSLPVVSGFPISPVVSGFGWISSVVSGFSRTVLAQQPIFRTETRLIVETVTVKDKDGRAIEGLTAKDFAITEDGEPQQIAFVEFQRLAPLAPNAPNAPNAHNAHSAPVAAGTLVQIGRAHV